MKIIIIGTGYVGTAYKEALEFLGYKPVIMSRSNGRLTYEPTSNLFRTVKSYQPDVVINAAGYTGRTVDDCQTNRDECFLANCKLASDIAHCCAAVDAKLIHISTGCMFQGLGPFNEESEPDIPADNYYLWSKRIAEQCVELNPKTYTYRIRMPFNHVWHRRNLLVKLATYPRILDGINSLTFLDEFCMRSWKIAESGAPGIYHAAYPTPVRTVDVARLLYVTGVRTLPFELYDPAEFIADGHVRRSAAVLDSSKFEKAFGAPFGDPFCALRWCIDRLKENRSKSCSCSQSTSTSITTSTSRSAAVR